MLCSCAVTSTIIWSGHNCTRERSMDTGPYTCMLHFGVHMGFSVVRTRIQYFETVFSFISQFRHVATCNNKVKKKVRTHMNLVIEWWTLLTQTDLCEILSSTCWYLIFLHKRLNCPSLLPIYEKWRNPESYKLQR